MISLDGPTDYRLGRVKAHETFITPLGAKGRRPCSKNLGAPDRCAKGRALRNSSSGPQPQVPEGAHGCARFTFAELCEAPLGPPDYLALAANFQTVFVEGIPALKASQRNEAKRFVLLIDTLYDARLQLVASSAEAARADLSPGRPPIRVRPHRFAAEGNAVGLLVGQKNRRNLKNRHKIRRIRR